VEIRSRIVGTGLGVPSRVVTNKDLEKLVDTTDEWIETRTGIKTRRVVDTQKGESNSSLSLMAARQALQKSQLQAKDIECVLLCTATPDTWMPISAARVAGALDIPHALCMDINAACSGFVTGLSVADAYIRSGTCKHVLVMGTDVFSHITDWKDRSTCVLFGDGSGAVVVSRTEVPLGDTKSPGILATVMRNKVDSNHDLAVMGGGSLYPFANLQGHKPLITMNGPEVFKMGTRCMSEAALAVLEKANIKPSEVDWMLPHQANRRIIEKVAGLVGFPMEKVFMNVEHWGNTSAATVAIGLSEMVDQGLLKPGQILLMSVFGGGFTYGATLIRW
jgi:3-oxoacyl-[acyl-carrier-protein] synthase-3